MLTQKKEKEVREREGEREREREGGQERERGDRQTDRQTDRAMQDHHAADNVFYMMPGLGAWIN